MKAMKSRTEIMVSASHLNIKYEEYYISTVEFRTDGDIWPLFSMYDGYHVAWFKKFTESQQIEMMKLYPPRYIEYLKEKFVDSYSFFDPRLKKIKRNKITVVNHGDHYYLSCVYYGKKYGQCYPV